ncbi:hypothetical protein B0H13DRAFT_1928669 [Mycena leptocephala]|nr:hypothetical protein B0H13DRAFT_1928669 [Mycena leptocephala]
MARKRAGQMFRGQGVHCLEVEIHGHMQRMIFESSPAADELRMTGLLLANDPLRLRLIVRYQLVSSKRTCDIEEYIAPIKSQVTSNTRPGDARSISSDPRCAMNASRSSSVITKRGLPVRRSICAESPSPNCDGGRTITSVASDLDAANKCTLAPMGEFRKFRQPRPAPGAVVIGLIRELQPLKKLECSCLLRRVGTAGVELDVEQNAHPVELSQRCCKNKALNRGAQSNLSLDAFSPEQRSHRGKGAAPIQCVADSQVFNQIQFGSGAVGDVMASLARCWALTAASDPEPVAVKYQVRASRRRFRGVI